METTIVDGVSPKTQELLTKAATLIEIGKQFLVANGEAIEFDKYLTIKNYCKKYGIEQESVVTNWIRRGVIPPEDVYTIAELNGLRMIKDRLYK